MSVNELPNDIDQLKELVLKLHQDNQNKDQKINSLKDTILLLQRRKFGPSSEKDKSQLELFNELEEVDVSSTEDELIDVPAHKKKRGMRKPIADSLPRVDEIIDLDEVDKVGMKCIGEVITEKLEITPAKVFVRRIIRKKYAPIDKGSSKDIVIAKNDKKELLPKSMAGASLISYIIIAKYADALPLYRQESIFKRLSAEMTRQSMARWLIKVSEMLMPLYNLLQDQMLARSYIQIDETTTQVLNEENKKATSKSYMWVRYSGGEKPIVLFDYFPSRKGEVPVELLNEFSGYLQCDGYDGYSRACKEYNLKRVGCWDHARRKFVEASRTKSGKSVGSQGVSKIKKLYKIEKDIRHLSNEEKYKQRQLKSKPLLESFKTWLDDQRKKVIPTSTAGKAINYAFNEWQYLIEYINNGEINISNIMVENAIRPFVIGKKNWLFSSTVAGAQASAMYYSLIETAKVNGLDPFDYFNKMLEALPQAQTLEEFEQLLPLKDQFLAK